MRVPIKVDLHLPNFTYPGVGNEDLFEHIAAIAATAEASGFSSISAMDHLHQIEMVGPPDHNMLEGSTLLAALAARTSKLTLGLLVGSVTYRNPALAAKVTSTVDLISGGRAWQGIGAGWFEAEHHAYGFEYPELKIRFEMLEEALQIIKAMFRGERPLLDGKHFHTDQPFNNPLPVRGDIPVLIGGSGERKTLRLVAKYGDGCNLFGDAERAKHLLGVLAGHCEAVGRDYDEITKTAMVNLLIAPTTAAAEAKVEPLIAHGVPVARLRSASIIGDPDTIGEHFTTLKEAGIEGVTFSLPDVWDLESVALAGKVASAVFGSVDD